MMGRARRFWKIKKKVASTSNETFSTYITPTALFTSGLLPQKSAESLRSYLDFASLIEPWTKVFGIFVAFLYAVGLFVVNLHLYNYHAEAFSLARPQYVLVGLAWLFYTVLMAAPAGILGWIAFVVRSTWVRLGCGAVLIPVELFVWHSLQMKGIPPKIGVIVEVLFAFVQLTVIGIVFVATADPKSSSRARPRSVPYIFQALLMPLATLFPLYALAIWTVLYADFIYPNNPPIWGGGLHPTVVIVFHQPTNGDTTELRESLGAIELLHWTTKEPVIMVSSDTDFIVLMPTKPNSNPITIDKKLVASIHYQ